MTLPPGPRRPMLAQMAGWVLWPDRFMEGCRRRYGDVFTVRLLGFGRARGGRIVFLADPDAVKALFTQAKDVGSARQSLAPMFGGRSILLLDGAEHLRQRRLMLPPFHGERMARYGELIAEIANDELDRWPTNERFQLAPRFQAITLEVILRAVFGVDAAERRAQLRERITKLFDVTGNPLVELMAGLPGRIGPVNVRAPFERARDDVDELLYAQIRERRDDPALAERDDILSLLLQARDDEGNPMTDAELRDELVTLLLAGHETTATGLAWTFAELFARPDAHARARDEGDGPYLEAVVRETLRLRPPVPVADRILQAPLDVDGHRLPAGTIAAASIYLVHRREDLYPEPDAFRPERFLDSTPETYGWLPFGGGPRRCLGAAFATFEMRIVLREILARADLRPASARREKVRRRAIVLAPSRGAEAVLVSRASRAPRGT